MLRHDKHLFALHTNAQLTANHAIVDQELWLRIVKVLRLRVDSEIVLFNATHKLTMRIIEATFTAKNTVYGETLDLEAIQPLQPTISLLQAVPKRSVFEEILYNAAQLGVARIVPLITSKAHKTSFSPKEQNRFNSIMITACEQAKQFVVPTIAQPCTLEQGIKKLEGSLKILFDSNGSPLSTIMTQCTKNSPLTLLFGPEGGLTTQEIKMAQESGFTITQLTPTILRAEDAPLVGIGLLRTLIV